MFLFHAAVLAVLIPIGNAWAQTVLPSGADIATSLNAGNYNLALGGNATWNSYFFINGPANANISIDGRGNTINVGLANQIIWAVYNNSVALKNATVTTTAPITANRPTLFYHDTANVTSSLALENTTFTGFNHEGLGGSILYAYATGATLNVDGGTQGVTFYRNRGVGDAGGTTAVYFGSLAFNGKVTFDSNWTGSYGGAIAVYQARNFLTFNGETTFKNNHATVFGGAIDLWGGASTVNFNGPKTTFDGNYVYYTSAVTEDNPIHVNDQHARGGAINIGYLNPGGTDYATINFNKPVDFKNNYVVSTGNLSVNRNALGGAISLYDNGLGYLYRITFNDSALFQGNYAYALDALGVGNGGAIYYNAGAAQLTLSSGTQFLDNYAKTLGGAIYLQAGTINLNATSGDIVFQGNRQGASFDASYKPIASSGTPNAIYMSTSSTFNLNAGAGRTINFYDPIASATGTGVTLTVNKSGAGEVIFHGDNGATSLYNSAVRANTNVNGGTFTLADGVAYGRTGEGIFSVKTTGTVRGSNGARLLAQTVDIASGGTLSVNGGLFTIDAASPITLATGAAISGEGTLAATQNLVFGGTGVVTATVDAAKTLDITRLITGSGGLTKTGAGNFTLGGVSTYSGGTTISTGRLIATNASALGTGAVTNSGILELNFSGNMVNQLSGIVEKTGTGNAALTSPTSSVSTMDVKAGTLSLNQSNTAFTTSGSYTTRSNATTTIGSSSSLAVGGIFTQEANAVLNVSIGTNSPIITADSASLNGALTVGGYIASTPSTASALGSSQYTILQTANGISNNFSSVNFDSIVNTPDYLTLTGGKSADQRSYAIGMGLSWLAGSAKGHGTFTLANAPDAFDVDVILSNQTGPFVSGWNGNSLTKNGSGTLILSQANTYTGTTAINGGTLQAGTVDIFANSSAVSVGSGATFALNNYNQTAHNLSGAGLITLGSAILTANNSANSTFGGIISGTGNLTKTGTGVLTLSGIDTYSGGTAISQGRLIAANASALGTGAVSNSGILELNFTGSMGNQLSGVIEKTGTGTATLTGTTSSTTSMEVKAGTLNLVQNGTFATNTYTTRSSASTVLGNASTLDVNGAFTQETGSTLSVAVGVNSPAVTAESASLNGTLVVSGINTLAPLTASALPGQQFKVLETTTGTIAGNFSTLNFGAAASPANYLTLTGWKSDDQKSYAVGLGLSWLAGSDKGNGTFTLANAADTFDVDVVLANRSGSFASGWNGTSLIKNGSGTLILSAANTYSGTTTINGGTLRAGTSDVFANSSSVTMGGGATFDLNNYNQTAHNLSGTGFVTLGSAALNANNTANSTFGGIISGTGSLTKTGAGTLTLGGANTYTGVTTINNGTLGAGAVNIVVNSNSVTVGTGTTFALNNYNQTVHNLAGTGSVTLGSAALNANNTASSTFGGTISGTGSLTKTGTGTLTLGGTNTYTGATAINGGTIDAGTANIFAGSSALTIASGAVLNLNNYNQTVHNLTGNGAVTLGSATLNANNTASSIFSGIISGTGSLTKTGAGTLTLSNAASSVGNVDVNTGTLNLTQNGTFTTDSHITGNGATTALGTSSRLDVNGTFTQAAGSMLSVGIGANSPAITAESASLNGALVVSGVNTSTTLTASALPGQRFQVLETNTGTITGDFTSFNFGSASSPANYLTLTGWKSDDQKSYAVGLGLSWLAGSDKGNGTFTLANAADAFNVDIGLSDRTGSFTSGWNGTSLTKNGNGTLTLSAANTYSGGTIINGGHLVATNQSALGTGNVANSGTLELNFTGTMGNQLTGSGTIEKTGTGNVTLINAASSVGTIDVKAGTLNLSQNGTLTTNAYTTRSGATTILNTNSKLHVNGAFVQEAGSALSIGIGSNNLTITAQTASLNGSLAVSGVDASLPATASALHNQQFTVLETSSGINGDFTAFNFGSATSSADYLTLSGWKSDDEKSYSVGMGLSWLARSDKGNGTFTLINAADAFDVDIALEDRTGSFTSGWNGTSLTKNGSGTLTLSAANTYSGGTTINGGTLVAAHESALGAGNVTNNGILELNLNTDSTLSNALSGTGALEKTGTGATTLTASGSSAGAVTVRNGKLAFDQDGAFSSASHTTESGATTGMGPSATLNVAGSFDQQSGSTLNVALGSNVIGSSVTINADSGTLGGNLYITGFDASELPASVLVAKQHTILQTNNTLSGNFGNIDFGGTSTGVDYLTLTGSKTDSDTDYQVGFGLRWLETNGHGNFTMLDAAQTFDVDIQLSDQGWGRNGSDLIKSGEGTLILSAGKNDPSQRNTYTGKTLVDGGVISLRADTALGRTSELNIADTASVTLNGTSQQVGKLITQNGSRLDFGGGTMTITDTQRQSGDTAGGSIQADTLFGNGKLIVDPSVLTIEGANTGYTGDLEITGGSQVIMNNVAGVGNTGNIIVDGTNDTLTFDMLSGSVASGELKKRLSGQGTVQTRSSGTDITLAADNSAFSGQFDVGTGTTIRADQAADLSNASVKLDGSLVATTPSDWTMQNAITGGGSFLKDGNAQLVVGDTLSAFTGQTSVMAGTLIAGTAPSANVRIGGSVDIAAAATLSGTGTINGSVVNNGTIAALNTIAGYQGTPPSALTTGVLTNSGTIRLAGSSIGNTLTVRSGMTGNNGTVEINTQVGGDTSSTDRLILDGGATSGTTSLLVHNEGGAGAQTQKGILVIDAINGATTTTDAFSLSSASSGYRLGSGTMVIGAYDYSLIQGGIGGNANSWYLASAPAARPEAGVYLVNREGSESMFTLTLRDRLINHEIITDPVTGEQYAGAAWGRIDAKRRISYEDDSQLRTTSNTATLQSGLDLFGWSDETYGSFHGGFMVGVGTATSDTESRIIPGPTAEGNLTGYSVGVYGTWFQNEKRRDGLYVDTWLQHSWFDNELKGSGLSGENYKARMWSASVESGYTFAIKERAEGSDSSIFFTPSLQLIRLSYSADDFTEKTGAHIRQSGGDKWMTRLGGRLHGRFVTEGKTPIEPFVEANWWHSTQTHQVSFDSHTVRSDLPKNVGEIKVGVESRPTKNLSFSLSLSGQMAEKNYRQIGAQFGIRYSW